MINELLEPKVKCEGVEKPPKYYIYELKLQ